MFLKINLIQGELLGASFILMRHHTNACNEKRFQQNREKHVCSTSSAQQQI